MATDIAKVIANLTSFYDFRNKSVVHVGAGGGQFIAYASDAYHVVAVDPDAAALEPLRAAIDRLGLGDRFTVRQAVFESLTDKADVVFFEFCLHEMNDPEAVLRHARTLAPEALVIDHAPGRSGLGTRRRPRRLHGAGRPSSGPVWSPAECSRAGSRSRMSMRWLRGSRRSESRP